MAVALHGAQAEVLVCSEWAQQLLGPPGGWCWLAEDGTPLPPGQHPAERAAATGLPVQGQVIGLTRADRPAPIWLQADARPQPDVTGPDAGAWVAYTDIGQHRGAQQATQARLQVLSGMVRVHDAIQAASEPDRLMIQVLDLMLELLDADRGYLLHPCDPGAASGTIAMERVRPQQLATAQPGQSFPMQAGVAASIEALRASDQPLSFGPGADASFGSPAAGSTPHLVGSLFARLAGVDLVHVPNGGGRSGMPDVLGGQVAAYATVLGSFLPHLQTDRLRLLAVTGATRDAFAPDVPTFVELGFPLDIREWFGVFAPPRTPPATIQRAAMAVAAAVDSPTFVRQMGRMGMTAHSSTPQAMADRLRNEAAQWRVDIKRIGFTADS